MTGAYRDALDAAWGDFSVADAMRLGLDWLRYTGSARPTKEWVDECVRSGLRVTAIQETYSTRSQEGAPAGSMDCNFAETRFLPIHPILESIAVVVSDGDSSNRWDASAYGADWGRRATVAFFPYGTPYICDSFLEGAGDTAPALALSADWVPETWGQSVPGRRALTQVVGYSPVPNTDLNRVDKPYYPSSTPPPQRKDDDMVLYTTTDDNGLLTYYRDEGGVLVALHPDEAAVYYKSMTEGRTEVFHLGGVYSALAYSVASVRARRAIEALVHS